MNIRSAGIVLFRIQNDETEYLLIQHPDGHWDVPKGKIESGESTHEAAIRELAEETGLKADFIEGFQSETFYQFIDKDGVSIDKSVFFFLGKAQPGTVILSHEHLDFIWLPYDAALKLLTYDTIQRVLREAHLAVIVYLG